MPTLTREPGYAPRHRADPVARPGGPRRRAEPVVRPRRRVGLVLVLVGLVLLGWVGWQYVASSWVAERRHATVVDDLAKAWQRGDERVDAAGSSAQAIVRIPRFGAEYAVPLLQGSSDEVLAAGIGHLDGSADPGQRGNLVLAAHRVTHGEPFAGMPRLRAGDRVEVETAYATYTYVLDTGGDDLTVGFEDTWVTEPRPRNPEEGGVEPPRPAGDRLITLTTCAALFETDDRLVAFGHLERVTPVL